MVGVTEQVALILHEDDRPLVAELAGTTEVELPSGHIVFYPPIKNTDHMTDSLRAAFSGILSLATDDADYVAIDFDKEFGFFEIEEGPYGY